MTLFTKLLHFAILISAGVLAYISFQTNVFTWIIAFFIIGRHVAILMDEVDDNFEDKES
jgi:hypothetical protein